MARINASKARAKGAKAKAPAKRVAARKPTKGAKKAPLTKRGAKRPVGHVPAARKAAVRRQVARPRKGQAHADMDGQQAGMRPLPVAVTMPPAPADGLHANWGDVKERSVTRNDKPQNWFRRGAKPPQK